MNAPLWAALPAIVLVALAARADVRTRRIPNLLVGTALLLALATHFAIGGLHGLAGAALGALLAGGLLLPGWLMRWMGAGDVKLMAAVGAWLGHPLGLVALLAALMAGGVIAIAVAMRRRMLMQSLWNAAVLGSWVASRSSSAAPSPVTTGVRFPFALAAAAGVLIALWIRL